MARKPFKLKSGNTTSFKMMGSSPLHIESQTNTVHYKKSGDAHSQNVLVYDDYSVLPDPGVQGNLKFEDIKAPTLFDLTPEQFDREWKAGNISEKDFKSYKSNQYKKYAPAMTGNDGGFTKDFLSALTWVVPGANITKLKHLSKLKNVKMPSWMNKKLFSDKSFNVGGKTMTVKGKSAGNITGDLLKGTGIGYEGKEIQEGYKKKREQGKSWLRSLSEATYDETGGFLDDIKDWAGAKSGWWNPTSRNYPWGGERRNIAETRWDANCPECKYDDKTGTWTHPKTGEKTKEDRGDFYLSLGELFGWK